MLPPTIATNARRSISLCSPDDLVGPDEDGLRDRQTERLGGLHVDDQFELRRLLDGDLTRPSAFQDLVYKNGSAFVDLGKVGAVGDERSGFGEWAQIVDCWLTMLDRDRCQLPRIDKPKSRANENRTRTSFDNFCEHRRQLIRAADREFGQLELQRSCYFFDSPHI